VHVVLDHNLNAEIRVICQRRTQQSEQDAVPWLRNECDNDDMLKTIQTTHRTREPQTENNKQDRRDSLCHEMSSSVIHSSNQKIAVILIASSNTNQADAFA